MGDDGPRRLIELALLEIVRLELVAVEAVVLASDLVTKGGNRYGADLWNALHGAAAASAAVATDRGRRAARGARV
jgi:hypothetical protein